MHQQLKNIIENKRLLVQVVLNPFLESFTINSRNLYKFIILHHYCDNYCNIILTFTKQIIFKKIIILLQMMNNQQDLNKDFTISRNFSIYWHLKEERIMALICSSNVICVFQPKLLNLTAVHQHPIYQDMQIGVIQRCQENF